MRPSSKITLKMEAIVPSETFVDFKICGVTTQKIVPFNSYRCDNLRSYLNMNFIALIKNVFVGNVSSLKKLRDLFLPPVFPFQEIDSQ
jgi:hypothetical protein